MIVISRSEWGAQYGVGDEDPGPEGRVVIHHTYKPALLPSASLIEEMAAWKGVERFHAVEKGWAGIGYNWGVAPSGRILEGRGWKYRGAHAGPVNGDSIGIAILIDGNNQEPTAAAIKSVRWLISLGLEMKEIAPSYKLSGHRDHMVRSCPGDKIYNRLEEFRHDHLPEEFEIEPVISVKRFRAQPQPLTGIVVPLLRNSSAHYLVSRYAGKDERAVTLLERILNALLYDPVIKKKLGWTHGVVEWAVKKLISLVQ